MDTIIFRGKCLETNKWLYGQYTKAFGSHYINYGNVSSDEVIPETVGQFTCCLDKEGNEIYKDDIIDLSYISPLTQEKVVQQYYVDYKNGCFVLEPYQWDEGKKLFSTWLSFQLDRAVVIGNLHEN